jgi:hypothetical protein
MDITIAVLALLFSAIAVTVSVYSFKRTHKTSIKPVLAFSNDIERQPEKTSWYVQNVGNGPALNVIVGSGTKDGDWDPTKCVLLPALSVNARVQLDWLWAPMALIAIYSDSFGATYTTICVGNRNRVVESNLHPHLKAKTSLHRLRERFPNIDARKSEEPLS